MEKKLKVFKAWKVTQTLLIICLIAIVCQCGLTCKQICAQKDGDAEQCLDECQEKNRKDQKLAIIIVGSIFGPPIVFLIGLLFYTLVKYARCNCIKKCNGTYRKMKKIHRQKKMQISYEENKDFSKHIKFLDKFLSKPGKLIVDSQMQRISENIIKEHQFNFNESNLRDIEIKGLDELGEFEAEGCFVGKTSGNMFWFVKHYVDREVSKEKGDIVFESDFFETEIPEIKGRWYDVEKSTCQGHYGKWLLKVDYDLSGPHRQMKLLHNHPKDLKKETQQFCLWQSILTQSEGRIINEENGSQYPINVNKISQIAFCSRASCLNFVRIIGRDLFGNFSAEGYLVEKFRGITLWFIKQYEDEEVRNKRGDVIFESEDIGKQIKGKWYEYRKKETDGCSGIWNFDCE